MYSFTYNYYVITTKCLRIIAVICALAMHLMQVCAGVVYIQVRFVWSYYGEYLKEPIRIQYFNKRLIIITLLLTIGHKPL